MSYKVKNSPHNYPAQNVSGAVAEEPCLKGCARVKLIKSVNTNIPLYPKQVKNHSRLKKKTKQKKCFSWGEKR